MGTFFDVRCSLALGGPAREAWLTTPVEPVEPWTSETTSVRALLAALDRGGALINGHVVGSLPVRMTAAEVAWSWTMIASDVAPEVIRASRALWRAAVPLATWGVSGHRDALGPRTLWDSACALVDGNVVDFKELLPLVDPLLRDDREAVQPDVDFDDIPF